MSKRIKKDATNKRGWVIVDRNTGSRIRGPYKHLETAEVVRLELEMAQPDREWNLWILPEEEKDEGSPKKT